MNKQLLSLHFHTPRLLAIISLVVGFVLTGCSEAHAQQQDSLRHHSRHAQRRALVDSLRLQMRQAADNGRLLQWGDSLIRLKRRQGTLDSAKYQHHIQHLQRVDKRLHRNDQLLKSHYQRVNFDTLYIARPNERWTIKLRGNLSGARLKFDGKDERKAFSGDLKADYRGTMSVAVAYRGIALGIAINPAKLAGKSKDNEFNLNSYGNEFGFDIVYLSSKTYHGKVTSDGYTSYFDKGQVKQQAINLNGYYAFNHKRFSFPAAFTQSYIQKRNAGSIMIGTSLDAQQTDVANFDNNGGKVRLRIMQLGIGAGYGYNLVLGRHWLFHLSALPTMDVLIKSDIKENDNKVTMPYHFPSVIITGRGAAVYSWRNKFAGITMVYNTSPTGSHNRLYMNREKGRIRLFYGFRL